MDPVCFAGDRLVIHFFSYPRMWVSQGNPQKLKYCPWLRYPLFGPTLLSLTVQFKSYWWSSWPALCLKKPSELTLWPALIVLLRIVREQARVFTVSDKALQDLAWHLHLLPPPRSLYSSHPDLLVVLQLNQDCCHLRAFPLTSPTYNLGIFFSQSQMSTPCQIYLLSEAFLDHPIPKDSSYSP